MRGILLGRLLVYNVIKKLRPEYTNLSDGK